ncbi:MAG: sigma-70 family RNA polymerase sigma factor [Acidobacteria bacterium]|nr:sigma-70 family RNA polymerase sigma factor [Acidobacteriota bacterium]
MDSPPGRLPDAEARSEELFRRAKDGDGGALDQLFARYLPRLRRWAHGRVPIWARDSIDTGDLVQETALRAYANLPSFEPHHDKGALFGYLRRALINRIHDQFRHRSRHAAPAALDESSPDPSASPLESAIDGEERRRYESGLQRLRPSDRLAIVGRVELGYSYEQLALILEKPSPQAARLAVRRALLRLKNEVDAG